MLEQEGLAVTIPRKGAQVAKMTEKDLQDVLEVRDALDALAVACACQRMTDEQFVDLDVSSQLGRGCTEINFERTPQCKVNPLVKTNFWQKLRWIDKVGSRGKTREKVAKSR